MGNAAYRTLLVVGTISPRCFTMVPGVDTQPKEAKSKKEKKVKEPEQEGEAPKKQDKPKKEKKVRHASLIGESV